MEKMILLALGILTREGERWKIEKIRCGKERKDDKDRCDIRLFGSRKDDFN